MSGQRSGALAADGTGRAAGVLVAGRDPLLGLALRRSGVPVCAELAQAEALFAALEQHQPSVLILTRHLEGTFDHGAIGANLAWLFPGLTIVAVGFEPGELGLPEGETPEGWRFFPSPPDYRHLVEVVRQSLSSAPVALAAGSGASSDGRAAPSLIRDGGKFSSPLWVPIPGYGPVPGPPSGEVWPAAPAPQVITVCSPKGGVGKTFLAVNLAAALSFHAGTEVLLLDWDLPSADVAVYLDLREGPGLLELINSGQELAADTLRAHAVRHRASGLHVLRGPSRPELAEFVRPEHLRAVLTSAKAAYPVVVIDTSPSPCDEAVCQALEGATRILLVVAQDPACLYQARVFLDLLPRLRVRREAVWVAVNRHREGAPDLGEIQSFLGMNLVAVLPEEPAAGRAVAQGVPLVLARHSGPLAGAILDLAHRLYPTSAHASVPKRPRGFSWWRRQERSPRVGRGGGSWGGY